MLENMKPLSRILFVPLHLALLCNRSQSFILIGRNTTAPPGSGDGNSPNNITTMVPVKANATISQPITNTASLGSWPTYHLTPSPTAASTTSTTQGKSTSSTTGKITTTGCAPFPQNCPSRPGCAAFDPATFCPICHCAISPVATPTGCPNSKCFLDCGTPPKYKKDNNGCDLCECDVP